MAETAGVFTEGASKVRAEIGRLGLSPAVGAAMTAVGTIGMVLWWVPVNPTALEFAANPLETIGDTVAPLLLIAVFIERVTEVVITAWREEDAKLLEKKLSVTRKRVAAGEADVSEKIALQRDLIRYRSYSQRFAFLVSFLIALILSMLGVRALDQLILEASFGSEESKGWFVAMDSFITATLLAGGAEGVHKIVSVFTNLMESTKQRARAAGGDDGSGGG